MEQQTIIYKPAVSVTKASLRKIIPAMLHIKGLNCQRVIQDMSVSKKKFAKDIIKSINNTVNIINTINKTNFTPANFFVKTSFANKFKSFKKMRIYAKGRASFGRSHISRFHIELGLVN